jgi:hypothetical protein
MSTGPRRRPTRFLDFTPHSDRPQRSWHHLLSVRCTPFTIIRAVERNVRRPKGVGGAHPIE